MRLLKLLTGILLLPACAAVTIAFSETVFDLLLGEALFFGGAVSYLFLLAVFQQPIRTYVFGHELTHVLWIWLFGGRVKKFRVTASGGRVKADRANFLIFLAPYFFPVYTALAAAVFLLVSAVTDNPAVAKIFAFTAGFTWTFHLTFTIYTLLRRQPDIAANGGIFSLPLIYLANVIVLAALVILVSGEGGYAGFFSALRENASRLYEYLWNEIPRWGGFIAEWIRAVLSPK